MVRAYEDIAAGNCHVLGQLTLDRKVRLVRVRVLEILFDVQSKRQHWTKPGKRLIVEALAAELILSIDGHAGRDNSPAGKCATAKLADTTVPWNT